MSLGASGRHARGRRLGRRGAAGLALGTSESEAAALGPVASVVEFSGSRLRAPPWQRSMRGKKASLRRLHAQLSRRGCRAWPLLPWQQSRAGRVGAPHRMAGTLRPWPRTRGGYRLGSRLGVCSRSSDPSGECTGHCTGHWSLRVLDAPTSTSNQCSDQCN